MAKDTVKDTSWEKVNEWYDDAVGRHGHYYHQHVILPNLLRLLNRADHVLDVGCGQGILARELSKEVHYCGLDSSSSLIAKAKALTPSRKADFFVHDAERPFTLNKQPFSHAVIILALQNMRKTQAVIENIYKVLVKQGKLLIVLNHPCFRIARQSGWSIDDKKKLQSRRIDSYMSSMEIPIQANPSKGEVSSQTITFHHPLSFYSKILHDAGFCIDLIEEWCSDKTSTGGAARMENRARKEFPLFLAIVAKKI